MSLPEQEQERHHPPPEAQQQHPQQPSATPSSHPSQPQSPEQPHLTTLNLAHLPPSLTIHIALYTTLRNASFLHSQLLAANPAFEYAFIDARAVLSTTHLFAAVFRACTGLIHGRLRTRNVHSETVFALAAGNNIAEAFRRFGVVPGETRDLIVVKIVNDESEDGDVEERRRGQREAISAHLRGNVEGASVPLTDAAIAEVSDLALIRKAYKLDASPSAGRKKGKGGKEISTSVNGHSEDKSRESSHGGRDERREMELAAIGMMALKGS